MTPTLDPAPTRRGARVVTLVFLGLIAVGPALWFTGQRVRTRSAPPWPEFTVDAFLDGRWTETLDEHLRETSPLTAQLRGVHRDLSWLLGLEVDGGFAVGRAGVWYLRETLWHPVDDGAARAARVRAFDRAAAACAAHGVRLLAVPVPDKRRALPDALPRLDPANAARLERRYRELLADLDAAGIAALDLATPMAGWRAARPFEPLFCDRDSHWTFEGAVRVADHIAAALEARGWLDGVERLPLAVEPVLTAPVPTDLVSAAGFRDGGAVHRSVSETLSVSGARCEGPAPPPAIALVGDSFANRNLPAALTTALATPLDAAGALPGAGPAKGLGETLARIASGESGARVVVWVFIERAMATTFGWADGGG